MWKGKPGWREQSAGWGVLLDGKPFFLLLLTCTQVENKQWEGHSPVVIRHTQLVDRKPKQTEPLGAKPRLATVLLGMDFWTSVYPVGVLKF